MNKSHEIEVVAGGFEGAGFSEDVFVDEVGEVAGSGGSGGFGDSDVIICAEAAFEAFGKESGDDFVLSGV